MAGKTKPANKDVQESLDEIQWTNEQMRYLNVMSNKMRFNADIASLILEAIFSDPNARTRGDRSNNAFSLESYKKHKLLHDDVVRNPNKGNVVWLKQIGDDADAKDREGIEAHIKFVAEEKDFEIHETSITVEDDDTHLAIAAQQDEEHAAKKRKRRHDTRSQDEHTNANVSVGTNSRAQTDPTDMASPLSTAKTNTGGINSAHAVDVGNNQPRVPFETSPMDQMLHQRAHDQVLRQRARHGSSERPYIRSRLAASETVNTEAPAVNDVQTARASGRSEQPASAMNKIRAPTMNDVQTPRTSIRSKRPALAMNNTRVPAMNDAEMFADEGSGRDATNVNKCSSQESITRVLVDKVEAGPEGDQDFDVSVTTTTQREVERQQGPSSSRGRVYFLVTTTVNIQRRQSPPQ